MRDLGRLALVVVLVAGCGGKKDEPKTDEPKTGEPKADDPDKQAPSPTVLSDARAQASAESKDSSLAPTPPDASLLGDLPPLSLAVADQETIKKSVNLNNVGYAAHKKKDWPAAEAGYIDAVKADPGNLRARFNLACVYSSSDQADKAFAVLSQFKAPDCRACDAVLLKAKTDHEWKARLTDPRFVALQEGITAAPTNIKKVTEQLQMALRKKKPDGLEAYIHPRNPIKVDEIAYGEDVKPEYFYGWEGFVKLVGTMIGKLEINDIAECNKKNCCSTGERGDSSFVIDEVCFEGGGDVLFISSITFDSGPI